MKDEPSYRIFPLGDSAITIDFGNVIDEEINKKVITWFHYFQENPLPAIIEIIPAYCTLTFYYDIIQARKSIPKERGIYEWVKEQLEQKLEQSLSINEIETTLIKIPVCYENEFAPDIEKLAESRSLSVEQVIHYHESQQYRVYMIGFLPGFAYLGEVDERIRMPRKPQPAQVSAGSIGIAGNQTGIYPIASPGGWQIIGRTPLQLFDATKPEPALVKPGDTVQFYSISAHEFANYKGGHS